MKKNNNCVEWRHEINKKERINALLDEETRKLKAQKDKSRAYLLNLESKVEADCCWVCMVCMQNEVSVVFLPCKHQVLCFPCFGRICNAVGSRCPSCGVKIEEGIKAYGRST
ncbi:RING/U-box superfamily protein [Striga asiatica]|uniref:RING/U-box superfamily protein n=1 Tax=Striga asiatica TaxID=4170 RepID=A0A5A7RMF7_STRAF|nr:RING/U-box superfamily protein [Striga asiatica]